MPKVQKIAQSGHTGLVNKKKKKPNVERRKGGCDESALVRLPRIVINNDRQNEGKSGRVKKIHTHIDRKIKNRQYEIEREHTYKRSNQCDQIARFLKVLGNK